MSDYSQCPNGHYYKVNLPACPYCPSAQPQSPSNAGLSKTLINSPSGSSGNNDLGKTQILGDASYGPNDKTKIMGGGSGKRDLSKTFIAEPQQGDDSGTQVNIRSARKLTGWLISYTIDPMGLDFKIFEGNNTIGRDSENSICITTDSTISGHHATILNKKDKFYIKDEMAANGTFINGLELEVGKPYDLKDKDVVKVGSTVFKFHTAE